MQMPRRARMLCLTINLMSLMVWNIDAVALDGDCASDACDAGLVCESNVCKVKADGTSTGCTADDKCPTNAACTSSICNCNIGYINDGNGLCTVVIGMTCSSDSTCSNALANSYCEITSPCTKGSCTCSSGYGDTDCLTLGYDKTCSGAADKCRTGLTCDSATSKCKCSSSSDTYRTEISSCTSKKLFGESCTDGNTDTDCLVAKTTYHGECINGKCACEDGYLQEGYTSCRKPQADESCTSTVGCGKLDTTALITSELSQTTPTCSSGSYCVCGTAESLYRRQVGGKCYTYCLTDLVTGTKAAGEACSAFNQCASKVCIKCPGDSDSTCYDAPCSFGMKITANGIIGLYFSIILLSYLF